MLDEANLGPKIYKHPKMGLYCKISLNLGSLDLGGISFQNCNMLDVICEGSNLKGCNFIGSKNLSPKSFKNSINFENANFFEDQNLDEQFKMQIMKYSSNNLKKETSNNSLFTKIAYLFDLRDTERLDNKF